MLKIVGFGSGAKDNMTLEASAAIAGADLIVGYTTYVDILKQKAQFLNPALHTYLRLTV